LAVLVCALLATTARSGPGFAWGVGLQRWSFFLYAEAFDDAFDAASADGQAALSELLGNDLGRSLGVKEAMPNRLANGFLRATVGPTGARRLVDQGSGTLLAKGVAELEVTLLAVVEDLGGFDGAQAKALASDEHGELAGDFVVGRQRQSAGWANQSALLAVEVKHGGTPEEGKGRPAPLGKIAAGCGESNE
jgi:hypothetical protein